MRFSEAVHAVVSQQLLPLKGDTGRVVAVEVLLATPAIRECRKDPEAYISGEANHGRRPEGAGHPDVRAAPRRAARGRADHRRRPSAPPWPPRTSHLSPRGGPGRPDRRNPARAHSRRNRPPDTSRCHAKHGIPEALKARELASEYLTSLGYTVAPQSFTFAPSSLRVFPIFGAGLGWPRARSCFLF